MHLGRVFFFFRVDKNSPKQPQTFGWTDGQTEISASQNNLPKKISIYIFWYGLLIAINVNVKLQLSKVQCPVSNIQYTHSGTRALFIYLFIYSKLFSVCLLPFILTKLSSSQSGWGCLNCSVHKHTLNLWFVQMSAKCCSLLF